MGGFFNQRPKAPTAEPPAPIRPTETSRSWASRTGPPCSFRQCLGVHDPTRHGIQLPRRHRARCSGAGSAFGSREFNLWGGGLQPRVGEAHQRLSRRESFTDPRHCVRQRLPLNRRVPSQAPGTSRKRCLPYVDRATIEGARGLAHTVGPPVSVAPSVAFRRVTALRRSVARLDIAARSRR